MSLFHWYDNFNPDAEPPIKREKCLSIKDIRTTISARCCKEWGHEGKHQSMDHAYSLLEEWE